MLSPLVRKAIRNLAAPASRSEPAAFMPERPTVTPIPVWPDDPPPASHQPVIEPPAADAAPMTGTSALPEAFGEPAADEPDRERFAVIDDPVSAAVAAKPAAESVHAPPISRVEAAVPAGLEPTLDVGRIFSARLSVSAVAHVSAGAVAGAASAGVLHLLASPASPALAGVAAFSVFCAVLAVWTPAALDLSARSAWRHALRGEGKSRAFAEGLAAALMPASDSGDRGGLGLYRLRERLARMLDEAIAGSVRSAWVRRLACGTAARHADAGLTRRLGPVGAAQDLDRDAVCGALTQSLESALAGTG